MRIRFEPCTQFVSLLFATFLSVVWFAAKYIVEFNVWKETHMERLNGLNIKVCLLLIQWSELKSQFLIIKIDM
jgi:hypothetical protein